MSPRFQPHQASLVSDPREEAPENTNVYFAKASVFRTFAQAGDPLVLKESRLASEDKVATATGHGAPRLLRQLVLRRSGRVSLLHRREPGGGSGSGGGSNGGGGRRSKGKVPGQPGQAHWRAPGLLGPQP